jgi:4'-phosphopantetheinyl transferase EntD
LAPLLPAAVAFHELRGSVEVPLTPEDAEALGPAAVERRRREFAGGRACARTALGQLGIAPVSIGRGKDREPIWPDGVVGSITHCEGYRAAAVARRSLVRSVGIDAEPAEALPERILERIARVEEVPEVLAARELSGLAYDRLLFSAKESVYKAWYPLTGRWLGFEDARVSFTSAGAGESAAGEFTVELMVPGPVIDGGVLGAFAGRYAFAGGLLATAVIVPARPRNA